MMKHLLVAALVFVSSCGGGDSSTQNDPALTQMLESQWSDYTKTLPANESGIAIFVMTPEGDYFASTGIENASPGMHFRAASNTKTFTSAAVMLLQQEGKLNINDRITSNIPGTTEPYIPDTADYAIPYKDRITIKDLLSHRAGVFDVGNYTIPASCDAPYAGQFYTSYVRSLNDDHTFSTDELVGAVADCRLSFFEPGQDHHYSNTGYSMLVKIIERVSGLAYSAFLEKYLFAPNQLFNTTAPDVGTDRYIPNPFALGHYLNEGLLYSINNDNMSENVGEGNIISTPANLARWVRRLVTGRAGVSPDSIAQMTECVSRPSEAACYGLGLIVSQSGEQGIGHNGAHMGYMSLMLHDPQKDVTFVAFTNLTNFDGMAEEQAVMGRIWLQTYKVLGL